MKKIDLLMENGCAMRREIQKLVFEKSELDQQIGRLEVQVEHLRAGVQMTVELDPDGNSFRMDFQQPRPNWVSVQERLPGYGQDVLCYRPEMAMKIVVSSYDGYYGEDDNEWYEEWSNFGYDADGNCLITHWMPLPEPPSTEEVE